MSIIARAPLTLFAVFVSVTTLACNEEIPFFGDPFDAGSADTTGASDNRDVGSSDTTGPGDDPDATETGDADDNDADADADADDGDGDGDGGDDTDVTARCTTGFTCSTRADCGGSGLAFAQCVAGCCVAGTGSTCQTALAPCSSRAQSNEDFYCDTAEGVCLQRCDLANADRTRSADCPIASYCLGEDPNAASPDFDLDLDGHCVPGDCDTSIFDAEACDGVGTCLPIGNGASYCLPAGTAAEGADCARIVGESRPPSDICRPGLLCSRNECVRPCDLRAGDADCGGGESCIAALDTIPANQPGLCGVACSAFSRGQCGETQSCEPLVGRARVNAWMCTDLGAGTVVGFGGVCTSDGPSCAEGAQCTVVDETTDRCIQICDPLGAASGIGARCASDGEVCVPGRLPGVGLCRESCEPYPRRAGDYDCDEENQTCIPFVSRTDQPTLPQGYCSEAETGTANPGQRCSRPGFHGGDCADFNVCLPTEGGGSATCFALCEPLSSGQCAAFSASPVCSPIAPLLGSLNLAFCTQAQPGRHRGSCSQPGDPCDAEGTVCIGPEGSSTCERVCRQGLGDCDDIEGTCETGLFNPEFVPSYMGLCR